MTWKTKAEVARLRPGIEMLHGLGVNFSEIARVLTALGFSTRAGKTFTCKQVQRLLEDNYDGDDGDPEATGAEQDELPLGLALSEACAKPSPLPERSAESELQIERKIPEMV